LIFSLLFSFWLIVVCPFLVFPLAIMLYVLLRFTDYDTPYDVLELFIPFTGTCVHIQFVVEVRNAHRCSFLCFVLFVFMLCLECPMLIVYLGCPFLIAPSVFTNVYYIYTTIMDFASVSLLFLIRSPILFKHSLTIPKGVLRGRESGNGRKYNGQNKKLQ